MLTGLNTEQFLRAFSTNMIYIQEDKDDMSGEKKTLFKEKTEKQFEHTISGSTQKDDFPCVF